MQKEILVNDAYLPYIENRDRYLVLYGSAGSGKSVFAAQKIVLRLTTERGHRFLLVRKVANTLRSSVYQLILDTIREMGLFAEFEVNKTEMRFTHKPTGNEILMGGLDDVEKLKSITGITGIWIEEATEINSDDFDQLDLRLRGETPNYKQIILSFNPIDERNWLKGRFFDEQESNCTVLKTTYRDNEFLDEEYKQTLELKARVNPNYYRIYVLGEWGRENVDRPFIYNFDYSRHVGHTEIKPNIPVRFSIDFNFDPFVCLALQIWTDKDGHHVHFIKEHVLHNKGVTDMIEVIKSNYSPMVLSNAIWTGDATQRKRTVEQNIVSGKNLHAWEQIDRAFRLGKRLHTPNANPHVSTSREQCNYIFALHPDVKINPEMKLLINEIQFTEADEDGGINKKSRAKETQRADALDCGRYAFSTWLPDFVDRPQKYGVK